MDDRDELPRSKPGIKNRIRGVFITGIVTLLPIGLTFFVFKSIVEVGGAIFEPLAKHLPYPRIAKDLIGFGSLLAVIMITGAAARTFIGRFFFGWTGRIMTKIPLIKIIYNAVKELTETFFIDKRAFQKVVMVEYPRQGCWSIGFLTNTESWVDRPKEGGGESCLSSVFIPTTPNPTSGFYLLLPKGDITVTDMTVEEGIRAVVSGGIITPKKKVLIREDKKGKEK